MVVYLLGFMGCGKSSIGRRLASRMGFRFADTDREAELKLGKTIVEVFEGEGGEALFRRTEREALEELSRSQDDVVVATGGGLPCGEGNMELMNSTGITVYLRSSSERLVKRMQGGRDRRPLIKGMDDGQLEGYILRTMPGREVFYGQAAVTVDCDGASDEYIVAHIARMIDMAAWTGHKNGLREH